MGCQPKPGFRLRRMGAVLQWHASQSIKAKRERVKEEALCRALL
jgi:hypothetical protein